MFFNLPEITFVVNNQGNKDIRCLNYLYQIKSMGVQSALYRCHTKGCYASISLKTYKVDEVNGSLNQWWLQILIFNSKSIVSLKLMPSLMFDLLITRLKKSSKKIL